MISYQSINGINKNIHIGKDGYSFYKYDGSNLRWEWNKKNGFFKFGTRNHLFNEKDLQFGEAISLFFEKYNEHLSKILFDNFKQEKVIVFTEYFGKNSFAGTHQVEDIKKLKVFDIHILKKGLLSPKEFLKIFDNYDFMAEFLGQYKFNKEYIQKIQLNENNLYNEGVVIKGGIGKDLWMGKIKTLEYIEKLKQKCTSSSIIQDNIKEQTITNS